MLTSEKNKVELEPEPSAEALALRRHPLGKHAVELLLALQQGRVAILRTTRLRYGGQDIYRINNSLFSPHNFGSTMGVVSGDVNLNAEKIVQSLARREYLSAKSAEPLVTTLNQSKNKLSGDKLGNLSRLLSVSGQLRTTLDILEINRAGLRALEAIPERIRKLQEKEEKYLLTFSKNTNSGVLSLGGIYRIERQAGDRVFVSREPVPGMPQSNGDAAIHYASAAGNRAAAFVLHKDIFLISNDPSDFLEIWQQSKLRLDVLKETQTEHSRKLYELEVEFTRAKRAICADLNSYIQETGELLKKKMMEREFEKDEEREDAVSFEDDDIEVLGFHA